LGKPNSTSRAPCRNEQRTQGRGESSGKKGRPRNSCSGFGKQFKEAAKEPTKGPNLNLTAALRASLESIDNPLVDNETPEGFDGTDSPLEAVTTDSVDLLLDRVNEHLTAGLPDRVTDDLLRRLVDNFRAQALYWEQEEAKPKTPRGKTPKAFEKLDLQF
jgi:hypothetical protein